ncbi:lysylphosphatidylglycerol synthase domain-containing protein [Carbonactinospora thermoautotrophica]|uniref:lysylphosphatidylglycerol synthase domain-containing protein n=1 Tax=Carbonactinospora thermoautotrophica TaxID=1469144 RepID=UPI003DA7D187
MRNRAVRAARVTVGLAVLALAVAYLARVVDGGALARVARAVLADPLGLAAALGCYAAAFGLRAWSWRLALPGLGLGQSWAALHVSLLGNHVLPLRLGEALRVTSVLRRTSLPPGPVLASALTLRAADLLAVLLLALVAVPELMLAGRWLWAAAAALVGALVVGLCWMRRLRNRVDRPVVRVPPVRVALAAFGAWALEAAVVWEVARAAGQALSPVEAVAVTAATIAAQTVAVTPGGLGSYEAAATAALAATGVPAGAGFAIAPTTHAVKTAYSLAVGAVALCWPEPGYWGRLRLPKRLPPRPAPWPVAEDAPVVAFIPVYNEEAVVGEVVRRLPERVCGRRLVTLVIDDGSTDASAERAAEAGAVVLRQPRNLGLGAAVRRGLVEAVAYRPAAVVYLDADGEYFPEDIERLAAPVLAGEADYVVGSRFAGEIRRMLPHRRLGNRVLTRWVRWLARRPDITDGQSGYRAFAPRAAAHAEVIHDYNYAQVLTLDLLGKGYAYREVPIRYSFRETGASFVKLGRYLRKVVPAVYRELNAPQAPPPPSAEPAHPVAMVRPSGAGRPA